MTHRSVFYGPFVGLWPHVVFIFVPESNLWSSIRLIVMLNELRFLPSLFLLSVSSRRESNINSGLIVIATWQRARRDNLSFHAVSVRLKLAELFRCKLIKICSWYQITFVSTCSVCKSCWNTWFIEEVSVALVEPNWLKCP